jgi:hypothetical protein
VLRHELGIDILAGILVWIQGLYPAGKYNNIKIFNSVLCHHLELELGKCLEADDEFVGLPENIKCPDNTCNTKEKPHNAGLHKVSA